MSDEQQRPTDDNRDAWHAYWTAQGMPWRTEPEIAVERQAYLGERRAVQPDIVRGIYPFRDEHGRIRPTRADVEWLLATPAREEAPGHADQTRDDGGLDLRGADLGGADLQALPLAGLRGSLTFDEAFFPDATDTVDAAAIRLERADLRAADLDGALLRRVQLCGADLR